MATTLPLFDILCADKAGAMMALTAAGCALEPGLQTSIDHPMIGTVHRAFGVVRNLADGGGDATDQLASRRRHSHVISTTPDAEVLEGGRRLGERLLRGLQDPDNERVATKLLDGHYKYMPINKSLAGQGAEVRWASRCPLAVELPGLEPRSVDDCPEALRRLRLRDLLQ